MTNEEYLKEVGARVRRERMRRGWRQAELAKRLGFPRSRLTRIETGRLERLHLTRLRRVAEALGVTVAYLTLEEDHPFRGLVRNPSPSFEHGHLLELAAEGLAGRLLHAKRHPPDTLHDMAEAMVHCRGEPMSRTVIEAWLNNGSGEVET